MSQNTLQKTFFMVKSWWFVLFVMVFVVETIKMFSDVLFLFFFCGDISLYQLYSGITLHS